MIYDSWNLLFLCIGVITGSVLLFAIGYYCILKNLFIFLILRVRRYFSQFVRNHEDLLVELEEYNRIYNEV